MGTHKVCVLFDITKEIRAMGWTHSASYVETEIKRLLSTGNWPKVFLSHVAERKTLLTEPNLKARVIVHDQKQGKRRYLIQYYFIRERHVK